MLPKILAIQISPRITQSCKMKLLLLELSIVLFWAWFGISWKAQKRERQGRMISGAPNLCTKVSFLGTFPFINLELNTVKCMLGYGFQLLSNSPSLRHITDIHVRIHKKLQKSNFDAIVHLAKLPYSKSHHLVRQNTAYMPGIKPQPS